MYPASSTNQGGATARPGRGGIGYGQLFTGLLAFSLVGCVGSVSDPSPEDSPRSRPARPALPPHPGWPPTSRPRPLPPARSTRSGSLAAAPADEAGVQTQFVSSWAWTSGCPRTSTPTSSPAPFPGNYFTPISESHSPSTPRGRQRGHQDRGAAVPAVPVRHSGALPGTTKPAARASSSASSAAAPTDARSTDGEVAASTTCSRWAAMAANSPPASAW